MDFNENQRDEMPGKHRFSSNQNEELKITLLGAHMDFTSESFQSHAPVFRCHWEETEDSQGLEHWHLNRGAEMVSTLQLHLPFQEGFLFGLTVLLFSAPNARCPLFFFFFWISSPFRLIVGPSAASSKS